MPLELDNVPDFELKEMLLELDANDDVDMTSWEASFLESVCFKEKRIWSARQRSVAKLIVQKYEAFL